jgi:hypothetical protein
MRMKTAVVALAISLLAPAALASAVHAERDRGPKPKECDRPVPVDSIGGPDREYTVDVVVKRVNCNLARDVVQRHFEGNKPNLWKCSEPIFQGRCRSTHNGPRQVFFWYPAE